MQPHRLAVVSNRLPAIVKQGENGPTIQSGSGGLVTALDPVLRDRGGAWIGWLGIPAAEPETEALFEDLLARRAARSGYALKPVSLLPARDRQILLRLSRTKSCGRFSTICRRAVTLSPVTGRPMKP